MSAILLEPADRRWGDILTRIPHDVYHLPGYCAFSATQEGGQPVALSAVAGRSECLIPLIIRPIPRWLGQSLAACDATSPYGYASPLFTPDGKDSERAECFDQCVDLCAKLNVIAAFLRLHPLLPSGGEAIGTRGTIVNHGETVFVDLTRIDNDFVPSMASGHRYEIRRLQRMGFTTAFDEWHMLLNFAQIYRCTMRRVGASSYYQFSDEYFIGLRKALGSSLHLCLIYSPTGLLAAGALFTEQTAIMQYHLSGAAEEFLRLAPTKLALHEIIRWGRDHGSRVLHLGGGVGGRADSLFLFKAGFSTLRATFQTCQIVIDETQYDAAVRAWSAAAEDSISHAVDFFPRYRSPFRAPQPPG